MYQGGGQWGFVSMAILGEVKVWKKEMEALEWEAEEEDPIKTNGKTTHFTIRTSAGDKEDSSKCLSGKINTIATFRPFNFMDSAENVTGQEVSIAME